MTRVDDIPQVVMEAQLIASGYKRVAWDSVNASIRTPDGYDIDYVYTSQVDELRAIRLAYNHLEKNRRLNALETLRDAYFLQEKEADNSNLSLGERVYARHQMSLLKEKMADAVLAWAKET